MILLCCNELPIFTVADVNECNENRDGCAQICTDTEGSYTCSCNAGYNLANDTHQCDGEYSNYQDKSVYDH